MSLDVDGVQADSRFPVIELKSIRLPSDAISIARLRTVFSERFDGHGRIADGFSGCDFFETNFPEKPPKHLLQLNEMLCNERMITTGAFFTELHRQIPDLITGETYDREEQVALMNAESKLVEQYEYFRLADSPETARFLIEQIKTEGAAQANGYLSRSK